MLKKLLTAGLLTISVSLFGQTVAERAAVMEPIDKLFKGMKLGDSSMVHAVFESTVTMASVMVDKSGKPAIRYESTIAGFLKAVGTPHSDAWNEMIWDTKIEIDGNLAQVWTPYAFYVGKKFSHCGVDAFHLYKANEGDWKIFHLADTRQKDGCNIPNEISELFK